MGCSSCSNSVDGKPAGCKSNGGCATGSCGKLPVFDWLTNMELPNGMRKFDGVEIRFKNDRKIFFRNIDGLDLVPGDVVVTESSPGHDVGVVSCIGELAKIQMQKKHPNTKNHELKKIYRKAGEADIKKWQEARGLEEETMHKARALAQSHKLVMKISDVEYQGDKNKATFYYTADERVDFRALIKSLADSFKVRIEMKQIGARQEAGRLGGIGSCGRELCCSTWLTDFRSVSTSAARYQQLSLNPQKLAGQCGKLKCCLNYELDQYVEAYKTFPSNELKLKTDKGLALHQKTDIFKGLMWYAYADPLLSGTHVPLKVDRVKEIIALNKKGKKPSDLEDFMEIEAVVAEPDYTNVVGQDSLTRFDKHNKKKKRKNNRSKPKQNAKKKTTSDAPKSAANQPAKKKNFKRRKPKNNKPKGAGGVQEGGSKKPQPKTRKP